jgi:polar amino acid transport system substrate-binding protein
VGREDDQEVLSEFSPKGLYYPSRRPERDPLGSGSSSRPPCYLKGVKRLAAVAALMLAGCGLPLDPEGTLERIEGGRMLVGVTEEPPWTILQETTPSGAEAELVERLAADVDASVEWVDGSEESLLSALEKRELDLVIGGLTQEDPWSAQVGFTRPYFEVDIVLGVPAGEPPPSDIDGLEVTVETGTETAQLVEDAGGIPVRVSDVTSASGPVVAEDWLLRTMGYQLTEIVLTVEKHVMAAAPGENAWLVRVERFLRSQAEEIAALLESRAA